MSPHADPGEDHPFGPRPRRNPVFTGITGVVAQAASWPADYETAVAARACGLRRVMLQFCDPETSERNRAEIDKGWALRWRDALRTEDEILKWWRVKHRFPDTPPYGELIWPAVANCEDLEEMERIDGLLTQGARALFLLGKPSGHLPIERVNRDRVTVFAECFREDADSDHTITNSHRFFEDAGLDMALWRPALQNYGTPFAPLEQQAVEARACEALGIAVYVAETASVADWKAIERGWMG